MLLGNVKMADEFKSCEFVNHIGQTIKPGDNVIYFGTNWNRTTIRTGRFEGCYYGRGWCTDRREYVNNIIVAVKISGINDKRLVYNSETNKWDKIPYIRTATLPRKRVYAINTSLYALNEMRI